jgi:dTDP-glucose 4,6-dehydratase
LQVLQKGTAGAVYNVGARSPRRNIDLVQSILQAVDKPLSLIRHVKDRPGHDRRYAIDPTRIERELGWKPRETLESGLRKTIRWYQENSAWVERARSGAYREFYARQYGTRIGAH